MSFVFVLQSVLIVLAIMEIVASRYPRIQQQIYIIAFAFTAVWCTAKYAYGPDISVYIPYYRLTSGNLMYDLTHPIHTCNYEKGFVFVCSLCKSFNLTFWEFTAIISTIYFAALALVFKQLDCYKTVALLVLVFFDSNLILVELRQCLAVSFFYIAIASFNKKHYIATTIAILIMLTMHKSASLILLFAILFYLSSGLKIETKSYLVLAFLLFGLLIIPFAPFISSIIDVLPLPESIVRSAKHHLLVDNAIQKVIIIYLATIFILAWYKREDDPNPQRHWMIWCCVAVLVFLYPYWFLLNRFRSYFIPFLIIYIINTITTNTKEVLPRQLYTLIVMAYICLMTVLLPKQNKNLQYPTDRISLVFERTKHSETELTERQLKQAIKYWEYDYKKIVGEGNQ